MLPINDDLTKPGPDIGLRGLDLLDYIIDIAQCQPENFDMRYWAQVTNNGTECSTAMCIGGWAAYLTGAKLIYEWNAYSMTRHVEAVRSGESMVWIELYAADVLHITARSGWRLFSNKNSLADVKRIRDDLVVEGAFLGHD